jgi:hypothetical protein
MPEASLYLFVKAGLVKKTWGCKYPGPLWRRFWAKVDRDGPIHPDLGTACWLWTGLRDKDGYGKIGWNYKGNIRTHRLGWELQYGEAVPAGLQVCHKCDNPSCVRGDHLFIGTNRDNKADSVRKKRHGYGERNGRAKLTEEQVREIRQRYRPRDRKNGIAAMSREFGVSDFMIHCILVRANWTHVD